jgi:hypothetical protein
MLRTTHPFVAGNRTAERSTIATVLQREIRDRIVLETMRFTCVN